MWSVLEVVGLNCPSEEAGLNSLCVHQHGNILVAVVRASLEHISIFYPILFIKLAIINVYILHIYF